MTEVPDHAGSPHAESGPALDEHALDVVRDPVFLLSPDGVLVDYTDRLPARSGYDTEDLAAKPFAALFEQRHRVDEAVSRAAIEETAVSLEVNLVTEDGEAVTHELTLEPHPERDGGAAYVQGAAREVASGSAREFERAEELLQQTQEVAEIGCWELEFSADRLRWTAQAAHIHGCDPSDPPTPEEAFESYHSGDRDTLCEAFKRLREDGEPYDLELRLLSSEDKLKWVRVQGEPWTRDGEIVGARGTLQDISDRVRTRQQLQRQRNDLETLNQMLSHDLRNNLQVVTGRAELLAEQVDEDQCPSVEAILENGREAIELIQTTQDLATAVLEDDRELQSIWVRSILEDVVEEARNRYPQAAIAVEGEIPNVSVRADDMLASVFRNLLNNAVQHNDKDDPEVVVSAERRGVRIEIRVADNGPGIPPERRESVFGEGEKGLDSDGTGLGLYLVSTLVDAYDGDVRIEDNDPEGTVFVLDFPITGFY